MEEVSLNAEVVMILFTYRSIKFDFYVVSFLIESKKYFSKIWNLIQKE